MAGNADQADRGMPDLAEGRHRAFVSLTSEWYWEQDSELRFTYLSPSYERRTGIDPATVLGRRSWERPAENMSEADWEAYRTVRRERRSFRDVEFLRRRPDGSPLWICASGEPFFEADDDLRLTLRNVPVPQLTRLQRVAGIVHDMLFLSQADRGASARRVPTSTGSCPGWRSRRAPPARWSPTPPASG